MNIAGNNMEYLLGRMEEKVIQIGDFQPNKDIYELYSRTTESVGKGAVGSIYDINIPGNKKYIIKIIKTCGNEITTELCKVNTEENSIIKIPYGSNTLYMMPNNLTEGLISGILNEQPFVETCPFYGNTIGEYYSKADRTGYLIMEKYVPLNINANIDPSYRTLASYYIFFQIAYALAKAQEKHEFTHYDLHTGNIVLTPTVNTTYQIRIGENDGIAVNLESRMEFDIKIIDFGFSRIKRGDVVLHPRSGIGAIINIFAVFNPCYDLTSFIGILLKVAEPGNRYKGDVSDVAKFIAAGIGLDNLIAILKYMYNIDDPNFDYKSLYYPNLWRPLHITKYHRNAKSMSEMSIFFLQQLRGLGLNMSKRNIKMDKYIATKDYSEGVQLETIQSNLDKPIPLLKDVFTLGFINSTPLLEQWVKQIGPRPYYHHTSPNLDGHFPNQIITAIFIDSGKAANAGYRFTTSCCKLDPKEYMKNHRGVAINGGFFDIYRTFLPIGPYRQKRTNKIFESNLEIPPLYKDKYGVIVINTKGLMSDVQLLNYDEFDPDKYIESNIFVSGPMLVRNGKIIFNDAVINSTLESYDGKILPFQCRMPQQGERSTKYLPTPKEGFPTSLTYDFRENRAPGVTGGNKYIISTKHPNVMVDASVPNCNMISPGELSHASNPNPRSMFMKRNNTDGLGDYAFVVVEGRQNRGDGVDLNLLSYIAAELKAIDAVNLDGGGSSALAWNFGDGVKTNNSERTDKYVAGNVLAVVKI